MNAAFSAAELETCRLNHSWAALNSLKSSVDAFLKMPFKLFLDLTQNIFRNAA